jgi:pimeloyl-ACP methyl ester carboxylesterase
MGSRKLIVPASDGAMLRVEEHLPTGGIPDDAPVVVLAHGWTLTRASWLPVIGALLERRRVRIVSYDQRGHGGSTMGNAEPSVRLLGEDLATVLSAMAPDGPLVLGGHSMGGMTVMAYAGQHHAELRERVRGVVLVSTAASIEGRRPIPLEGLVMRVCSWAPGIPPGLLVPTRAQRRLSFGRDARHEDVVEAVRQIQRTKMPTIGRFFTAISEHNELASLAHLESVPTHILVGSADRLTPLEWSHILHDEIPGSRLTVVEGPGHMLTYEATDVVADALVEMVDGSIPAQADPAYG